MKDGTDIRGVHPARAGGCTNRLNMPHAEHNSCERPGNLHCPPFLYWNPGNCSVAHFHAPARPMRRDASARISTEEPAHARGSHRTSVAPPSRVASLTLRDRRSRRSDYYVPDVHAPIRSPPRVLERHARCGDDAGAAAGRRTGRARHLPASRRRHLPRAHRGRGVQVRAQAAPSRSGTFVRNRALHLPRAVANARTESRSGATPSADCPRPSEPRRRRMFAGSTLGSP